MAGRHLPRTAARGLGRPAQDRASPHSRTGRIARLAGRALAEALSESFRSPPAKRRAVQQTRTSRLSRISRDTGCLAFAGAWWP